MTGPSALFQALLRPAILQILRASGYHSTKGAVLDALTDLAARYLSALCEATAGHAAHNHGDAGAYSLADVAIALRELGALLPDKAASEQVFLGADDVRGVDDFVAWFAGPRMRDLMEMGRADGDASDYLTALKKKHSKTGEDTKYHGTLIGKPLEAVAEIQVEGGPVHSIDDWLMQRLTASLPPPDDAADAQANGHPSASPPSSGLSSPRDGLEPDAEPELMDLAP